jgi:hypothetical protein
MTFVYKQCTWHWCSNNISRWMISMSIPYKPMKKKFHTTIIAKLWPMKFVIQELLILPFFSFAKSSWALIPNDTPFLTYCLAPHMFHQTPFMLNLLTLGCLCTQRHIWLVQKFQLVWTNLDLLFRFIRPHSQSFKFYSNLEQARFDS